MPHPRFSKLDATRRDRLLEAAAEEFAARGYDAASLNNVIARLGLSKGQFYYYFDDKADLFATVIDWTWQRVLPDDIDFSRLEASTFWDALHRVGDRALEAIRVMPWYIGLMRHLVHPPADPAVRAVVAEKLEIMRRMRLSLIRRGQELGCVRHDLPEELLLSIMLAVRTAIDHWSIDHWDALTLEERETLGDVLFSMIRGLLAPPSQVQ